MGVEVVQLGSLNQDIPNSVGLDAMLFNVCLSKSHGAPGVQAAVERIGYNRYSLLLPIIRVTNAIVIWP